MPSSIAALHLVGVHDGVDRPHVVGVGLDGGQPGGQRLAVVAGLLEPERRHAAHERGVRVVGVDAAQRADRPVAQADCASPRKKSSWCPNISASRSVGPAHEQVVEPAGGAAPVAAQPGADRRRVGLLALVAAGGDAAPRGPRAPSSRSAGSVLIRCR